MKGSEYTLQCRSAFNAYSITSYLVALMGIMILPSFSLRVIITYHSKLMLYITSLGGYSACLSMENLDNLCESCPARPKLTGLNLSRAQEVATWSTSKTLSDGLGKAITNEVDPDTLQKCDKPSKLRGLGRPVCGAGLSVSMIGRAHEPHESPEVPVSSDDLYGAIATVEKSRESPRLPTGNYKHKLSIEYIRHELFKTTSILVGTHHTIPAETEIAMGEAVSTKDDDVRPFGVLAMGYPDSRMYFAYRDERAVVSSLDSRVRVAFGLNIWVNASEPLFAQNYALLPR